MSIGPAGRRRNESKEPALEIVAMGVTVHDAAHLARVTGASFAHGQLDLPVFIAAVDLSFINIMTGD